MSSTYTGRYQQLTEQAAYRRRVEAFGLAALLAPYAVRQPLIRLPRQRSNQS